MKGDTFDPFRIKLTKIWIDLITADGTDHEGLRHALEGYVHAIVSSNNPPLVLDKLHGSDLTSIDCVDSVSINLFKSKYKPVNVRACVEDVNLTQLASERAGRIIIRCRLLTVRLSDAKFLQSYEEALVKRAT